MRSRKSAAAKASDYIQPFETIQAGDVVLPVCRVSGPAQQQNGDLDDAEALLLSELSGRKSTAIGPVLKTVASGSDPSWLAPAVALAKQHAAKLLAETTDRFIRPPDFDPRKCPDAQPTAEDFERLLAVTGDVVLVTLIDPDATPEEIRSHQRWRGQFVKRRRGGRPVTNKKAQREKKRPLAIQRRREGRSLAAIAAELRVPRSTIQDWVKGV